MHSRRRVFGMPLALAAPLAAKAQSALDRGAIMQVEAKIPLGEVRGRIDHLAVDLGRRRLFVAELGNHSLGVVDLNARSVTHRVQGLREPQGVAFAPAADILLVANAGDGRVVRYRGEDLAPLGSISLGTDADNLRLDLVGGGMVWVGHSGAGHEATTAKGGLTALDPASGRPVGPSIPLPAHPESFQLEAGGPRAFVNVPDAGGAIAVVDRSARRLTATWSVPGREANFPMALDERGRRLFVAFRNPPILATLDLENGAVLSQLPLSRDADDLFHDVRRHRVYAVCGQGMVDVFEDQEGSSRLLRHLARVPTAEGARTGLFVPEFDRLFLAARAYVGAPAALWVLRPDPP